MKKYLKKLLAPFNKLTENKILTYSIVTAPQKLLEPNKILTIIQSLQKNNIPTIAFTALLVGSINDLKNLKEHRFKALKNLGIDFSEAFSFKEILLNNLPSYDNNYPIYHQGILYTNGSQIPNNKGAVLVAFLKKINWKPNYIMMVDDVPKNLTDIAEALNTWDNTIQFKGLIFESDQINKSEEISEESFENYWTNIIKKVHK